MTAFRPGDRVRLFTKRGALYHAFRVGQVVELVRPASGVFHSKGRWYASGEHPTAPGRILSQIIDEADFVLEEQAPVPAYVPPADAAPALPPHPEVVPVTDAETRAVLSDKYIFASDEALEKAIAVLQFERSVRAYRAAAAPDPVKENSDA